MTTSNVYTINMNRFHRLSLWCRDCQSYWQSPNYLVVLHGTFETNIINRLLKINLYLYSKLFDLDVVECFGSDYEFDTELRSVFSAVKQKLSSKSKEIKVLDVDIIANIEENMSSIVDFVLQMKYSFDTMAHRILENSPISFLKKLKVLRKNILKSLDSNNIKCAIDNLMDLNIVGLDVLVQCVGIIFNCFYILSIDICEPDVKTPGVMYCKDAAVVVERIANISAQSFLYKYKRRWLVFYREVLNDCRSLFGNNTKLYDELMVSGNYEVIERALYDILVENNTELFKHLTILKHSEKYPKNSNDIYEWWSGRSKEQLQKIYNQLDDCLGMDKKTGLLPFILTYGSHPKDRMFHEILNVLHMFDRINPELSNAITFILRIYPEVYDQVYFPDRDRYMIMNNADGENSKKCQMDTLDNITDKNTLRKCENLKCQAVNKGRKVVWNLNTFEVGKHSMNTIFKELIKNPQIFEEIFNYAKKNLNIAVNSNNLIKKTKIVYK